MNVNSIPIRNVFKRLKIFTSHYHTIKYLARMLPLHNPCVSSSHFVFRLALLYTVYKASKQIWHAHC